MQSDSWLSKNVRPLVLVGLTLCVAAGVFLPETVSWSGRDGATRALTLVDATRFRALTELAQWVYGYYFLGRSALDKGAVRLRWERK